MRFNPERAHFLIRDTLPCFVATAFEISSHLQSRVCFCALDVFDHDVKRAQRHTRPVQANVAKQPVLNRVPFGTSWRVMAYRNRESAGVA